VAVARVSGTFVGSDADILNTGGGVFAPPRFEYTCSVAATRNPKPETRNSKPET
jgi:hypothetical protein